MRPADHIENPRTFFLHKSRAGVPGRSFLPRPAARIHNHKPSDTIPRTSALLPSLLPASPLPASSATTSTAGLLTLPMATTVESRRSRLLDGTAVASGTRSARSTPGIVDVPGTLSAAHDGSDRGSSCNMRKRLERSTEASLPHQKRVKLTKREEADELPEKAPSTSSRTSGSLHSGKALCRRLKRKGIPHAQRMRVLEVRYARLAEALIASQAAHTERKIYELKRGSCEEFSNALEPIEATRDRRVRIAETRLALHKAQADKEWHAAKTSAHFDFVKCRGDLRSSLRQTVSERVFDLSREYRNMSAEMLGVNPNQTILERARAEKVKLVSPQGSTLTEKDEDLMMLDISPATGFEPGIDAGILSAVPILQTFVPPPPPPSAPAPAPAPSFPPPSHEASRPRPRSPARLEAIRRAARTLPMPDTDRLASRGAPGNRLQRGSMGSPHTSHSLNHSFNNVPTTQSGPLPGISSFMNQDDGQSHGVMPTDAPRRPYQQVQRPTQAAANPEVQSFPPSQPNRISPQVADRTSTGHVRQNSDLSFPPTTASNASVLMGPPFNPPLSYQTSRMPPPPPPPSLTQTPVLSRPSPWSRQESPPVTAMTVQSTSQPTRRVNETDNAAFNTSPAQPAMSSNPAFNAAIGSQSQYVGPVRPHHGMLQTQDGTGSQRPFPPASQGLDHTYTNPSVPFTPQHTPFGTPSSINGSSHRRLSSRDYKPGKTQGSLLHPFRNADHGGSSSSPNATSSPSLAFPYHANETTSTTARETNGILWGELRR